MKKLARYLLLLAAMGLGFAFASCKAVHDDTLQPLAYYTVSFNSNGGSDVASQTIVHGNKATKPTNPTKAATEAETYDFDNWYTSTDNGATLSDTAFDFNTPITKDITLYAKWNKTDLFTVTITDGISGGTVTTDKTTAKAGETITLTITPESNYILTGFSVKNGETDIDITTTGNTRTFTMPAANVMVRATFRLPVQGKIGIYSAPSEVGDVVFSDGSVSPYSESFTEQQKNAAVAVIFDSEKKLGMGFITKRGLRWCNSDVLAYNTCEYNEDKDNGKTNTDAIANLEDYNEDNYPAFYFCINYTATGFTRGWYIPALNELQKLYDNKSIVENTFIALEKGNPFVPVKNLYKVSNCWSSNSEREGCATTILFETGKIETLTCSPQANYNILTCAIRTF